MIALVVILAVARRRARGCSLARERDRRRTAAADRLPHAHPLPVHRPRASRSAASTRRCASPASTDATLVPVFLARVPLHLPLDAALPRQCDSALPLLEAIEQRAARAGVAGRLADRARPHLPPRDPRAGRARARRHDGRRPPATPTSAGLLPDDVSWLLEHVAGRDHRHPARGPRFAGTHSGSGDCAPEARARHPRKVCVEQPGCSVLAPRHQVAVSVKGDRDVHVADGGWIACSSGRPTSTDPNVGRIGMPTLNRRGPCRTRSRPGRNSTPGASRATPGFQRSSMPPTNTDANVGRSGSRSTGWLPFPDRERGLPGRCALEFRQTTREVTER